MLEFDADLKQADHDWNEDCEKNFSKDGKDGKDDVAGLGGISHCQDMFLSIW